MYVAITRARRRLYLTHAQSRMLHGQTRYNIPSRFLDEIAARPRAMAVAAARAARIDVDAAEWGAARDPVGAAGDAAGARRGASARACGTRSSALGVIIDAEGRGSDARVQVNFRDAGVKWLALEYAKLEAALSEPASGRRRARRRRRQSGASVSPAWNTSR